MKNELKSLYSEIKKNDRYRFKLFILLFRLSQVKFPKPFSVLLIPVQVAYKIYSLLFLGIDIPISTRIGTGLVIHHGFGIVLHRDVIAGANLTLRHHTTMGESFSGSGVPRIGDNVELGVNTVLLGPITVESGTLVKACSILLPGKGT